MAGKGGARKSVIALNAGLLLGEQKKSVLLVDGDFIKPSLHILANKSPKYSVEIWLKEKELLLMEIVVSLSSKLDLLSLEGVGYNSNLKDWQFTSLLRRVIRESKKYDLVIFDFPTGYFPFMTTILFEIKNIILVTTSEPLQLLIPMQD